MSHETLFEPVRIGPVTAPNRFYAVPHATGHGFSQPRGGQALRAMKAEGGWGTVCAPITEIGPDTDLASHPMDRLWDERFLPTHVANVAAVKAHGALAGIELGHGGMRARNFISGVPVIGPSGLPILRPEVPIQARAMTLADIRAFRDAHRRAVRLAVRAGYDIVYVYAAHDISLLSNFLSRRTNRRSDAYGGPLANRVRLLREVLEDALDEVAGRAAVALRFSVHEPGAALPLTHDGEGREVVERLAALPDLWDVNLSGWSADSATARFADEGHQLEFTDFVKTVTAKPVVGVGRFTSPDTMVSVVRGGRLDLIGAARPSIADPFLPNKIREGRVEEIRECIGCNVCVSMDAYGVPLRCTQNPTIAEEWRRGWHPEIVPRTRTSKRVLVVGAGPAGLECAWTLLRAGHHVTVADARDEPGGRVALESRLPGLSSWRRVIDHRVWQLGQRGDADLYLASPMTAEDVAAFGADHVVVATGATWRDDGVGSTRFAPVDWGEGTRVLSPDDVLAGVEPTGAVTVYDDDHFYMASAIAHALVARGHEVRFATPHAEIAAWTGYTLEQGRIVATLSAAGVSLSPNRALNGAGDGAVAFASTLSGEAVSWPCGTLVMVGARAPRDALLAEIAALGGDVAVHATGDCLVPGTIQAAVLAGHRLAREILAAEGDAGVFRMETPADVAVTA